MGRALLFLLLVSTSSVLGAPKGSKLSYDQKQTGDYNIRVNLKDFQIVAIVDESLADLGSYDYNYDYSELTVKPGSVSTPSPSSTTTTETSTGLENSSATPTSKPIQPITEPVLAASKPTKRPALQEFTPKPEVHKPSVQSTQEQNLIPATPPQNTNHQLPNQQVDNLPTHSVPPQPLGTNLQGSGQQNQGSIIQEVSTMPSTQIISSTLKSVVTQSPDRIPVFVQTALKDGFSNEKKSEMPVTSVSIVPSEDLAEANDNQAPLGEIMYYRKCAQGFARDKRGRCRKIRRPQFPFGIARLASNLASKFRPSENEDSSTPSIVDTIE